MANRVRYYGADCWAPDSPPSQSSKAVCEKLRRHLSDIDDSSRIKRMFQVLIKNDQLEETCLNGSIKKSWGELFEFERTCEKSSSPVHWYLESPGTIPDKLFLAVKLQMDGTSDCMLLITKTIDSREGTRGWIFRDYAKKSWIHCHFREEELHPNAPLLDPENFRLLLKGGKVLSFPHTFTLV